MKKNLLCFALLGSLVSLHAQVPNNSFENWTSWGTYENPDGWASLNNKTKTNNQYTATKGTPGTAGASYLKLTSLPIGGGMVAGIAVSGALDSMTMKPVSGYGFTNRPMYFKGKWQYMVYGSTMGSIKVLLSKWNTVTAKRDTIAFVNKSLPGMVMSWANFNLTLTYRDSLQYPDSCMIVLRSSDGIPAANDYLWVDDLSFSGSVPVVVPPPVNGVGIREQSKNTLNFNLAPNPAHQTINLVYETNKEDLTVDVFDLQGKLIKTLIIQAQTSNHSETVLQIGDLPPGLYSVVARTQTQSTTRKLSVQ